MTGTLKIWVDADACPVVIRDILFRAAERTGTSLILVANQTIKIPMSRHISFLHVAGGFDVADNEIIKRVAEGDLVITADIPLAADAIAKGAFVLSPRGERYSAENIRARLNMRDFMETMRSSGVHTGGPPPLNQSDRKAFADQLDALLNKLVNRKRQP